MPRRLAASEDELVVALAEMPDGLRCQGWPESEDLPPGWHDRDDPMWVRYAVILQAKRRPEWLADRFPMLGRRDLTDLRNKVAKAIGIEDTNDVRWAVPGRDAAEHSTDRSTDPAVTTTRRTSKNG